MFAATSLLPFLADTAGRAARNGRREVAASAASPSPRHLARHPFRVDGCVHLGADRLAIRRDPNVWITLKELCAAVLIMTTAALSSVGSGVTTFPFRFAPLTLRPKPET